MVPEPTPGAIGGAAFLSSRVTFACWLSTMSAYGATMRWIAEQGGLFYPEEAIKQVKHKTLIVNGKQDKVVPPELGWKFSQLLENSWLYLIPQCGHWAMIEHPQEFCDMTTRFLSLA